VSSEADPWALATEVVAARRAINAMESSEVFIGIIYA
jgi:hypothetical protein